MSYNPKELSRVSPSLSLRLSPERKYKDIDKYCCRVCCCSPCICCPRCYCPPCKCCCCCKNPCLNTKNNSNYSPNELNSNNNKRNSNVRIGTNNSRSDNFTQDRNPYYNYDQIQFNEFLSKLMEVELKIERVKSDLANIQEFNIEDVFRIFENEKEYLTEEDLKNGLKSIGVIPNAQDIKLLMKRFDLFKKGNINFADFFDIIVPFEQNVRNKVESRKPNSCCPCRCPEVFSNQTLFGLRNLFNLIINSENEINEMRKMFGTLRLNLRDIFALLDEGGKGYFTDEELMRYLKSYGLLLNSKAADLLFIRLDKNRNGKIDYYEVEEEMETLY